ncbi:MAG: SEC-C metal-binding domain-containing protein [Gammaproteobacteria bacterium]
MGSHKFTVRLASDLWEQAAGDAKTLGLSLNSLVVLALRKYVVGMRRTSARGDRHSVVYASMRDARLSVKVGRNELCPCGSGVKHKRCCGAPSP